MIAVPATASVIHVMAMIPETVDMAVVVATNGASTLRLVSHRTDDITIIITTTEVVWSVVVVAAAGVEADRLKWKLVLVCGCRYEVLTKLGQP